MSFDPKTRVLYTIHQFYEWNVKCQIESWRDDFVPDVWATEIARTYSYAEARAIQEMVRIMER